MSINSELLARLERLGPVRVVNQSPLSSDEAEVVALRGSGRLDRLVDVFRRLVGEGATFREAKVAIDDLSAAARAVCPVKRACDFAALARDLAGLNVTVHRKRDIADPAAFIARIRTRHGLSQRGFAERLGLDVRTLQNWEQGRNRPESAVLSLITLFDQDPAAVERAVFEAVL
jgi:DNA-binding XRE family transcriptional regulator